MWPSGRSVNGAGGGGVPGEVSSSQSSNLPPRELAGKRGSWMRIQFSLSSRRKLRPFQHRTPSGGSKLERAPCDILP